MTSRDEVLPVQPVTAVGSGRPAGPIADLEAHGNAGSPEARASRVVDRALRSPSVGEALKRRLQTPEAELSFEMHDGKMVMRLKDPASGRLVRQIPPEEVLKIAESIDRYLGLLVDRHL